MKKAINLSSKNKYGQYFTPEVVADFMFQLADVSTDSRVLEPSCGEGVFLKILHQNGIDNITAFEIDPNLALDFPEVCHESFVTAKIDQKFDLIIGNPPYIRWKNLEDELKQELSSDFLWNKYFNSLCDYLYIFILKSIELLSENGQLIFICPEYWMNTTHSVSLRNYVVANGYFDEIYHFNETPIFDKVTVSTVIFKFIKSNKSSENKIKVSKLNASKKLTSELLSKLNKREYFDNAEYLDVSQFKMNERWILQDDETRNKLKTLEIHCKKRQQTLLSSLKDEIYSFNTVGDSCDIGNGMVSGLDKAFQVNGDVLNEQELSATIDVVKAKDIKPYYTNNITKYIFIDKSIPEDEFKEIYPSFYKHFQFYKEALQQRYQYNRHINYWEWVFLRNYNLFSKKEQRIFVPCKERISNKNYFRFALAKENIYPTQDVTAILKKAHTKESIEYILSYLNTSIVFDWLKNNGIVKGNIVEFSEAPIASIPFKKINWKDPIEVELHDKISNLTKQYLERKESSILAEIDNHFHNLLRR